MSEHEPDYSDSTRKRILDAAGPIFARHGFEQATIRDICRTADVNIASVKYYFGDKAGLYLETIHFARNLRADRFPVPDWAPAATPEQRLFDFVAALLRRLTVMQDAPWQVQLLARELMRPTDACRTIVLEYFKPMFQALLREISLLSAEPLTPAEQLHYGFGVIGQCLQYRFGKEVVSLLVPEDLKSEFSVEKIACHITNATLSAIQNRVDNAFPSRGSESDDTDPAVAKREDSIQNTTSTMDRPSNF